MMQATTTVDIPYPFPSTVLEHAIHPYLIQPIAGANCVGPMQYHPVPNPNPIIHPIPGIINQVWQKDLESEFAKIRNLLRWRRDCFLASIDTEFPGAVFASDKGRLQDPKYNYEKMKDNVNATNIIQLGLALSDSDGNCYVWEFNFSDFDIESDPQQNKGSVEFLKTHGIDFERNKKDGIPSSEFAEMCRVSGLVGDSSEVDLTWVGFQSSYDFGFFIKILSGQKLPDDMDGFKSKVTKYFGPSVFDMKHMITRYCSGVYGGLETVAETLGVARVAGKSHMAGSDSLLTLQTFVKLMDVCLSIETLQKFRKHMGYVNSRAPCDIDLALQIFKMLIGLEEEREKQNYFKLYRCEGALYSLRS